MEQMARLSMLEAAAVEHDVARRAAAAGRHQDAVAAYERAAQLYEQSGFHYLAAEVRVVANLYTAHEDADAQD